MLIYPTSYHISLKVSVLFSIIFFSDSLGFSHMYPNSAQRPVSPYLPLTFLVPPKENLKI